MSKCFSETFCSPSPHQAEGAIHGTYFPHIDGLRTFAVLAVVLYHLQEGICPGGYAGVDIFFVISGYLIGGGLIRSLKEGTFSVTSFYLRRIRRIMPAYFCLIAAVLAFGCVVLDCDDLRTLGRTVRSSALFITNTYFSRTTGDYFSPAAEENPLLNLWSLSVEEQFYLMIPLTLWLLWKFREKAVKPVLWGRWASPSSPPPSTWGIWNITRPSICFTAAPGNFWPAAFWLWLPPQNRTGEPDGCGRRDGPESCSPLPVIPLPLLFPDTRPSLPSRGRPCLSVTETMAGPGVSSGTRSARASAKSPTPSICGIGQLSCTGHTSVSMNALPGIMRACSFSLFFWVSFPGNSWKPPSERPSHGKLPEKRFWPRQQGASCWDLPVNGSNGRTARGITGM